MCENCKSPSINLEVSLDQIDEIFKAAKAKIDKEKEFEGSDLPQSPARKRLDEIVSETYDAMSFSMLKEISELFQP